MRLKTAAALALVFVVALVSASCRRRPGTTSAATGVWVTVTGLDGTGLVLQLNGSNDLSITADGSQSFAASLAVGDTYTVTVADQPLCSPQFCTVANGTGTYAGTAAQVNVTCSGSKLLLVSSNWGDNSLRFTDDLYSYSDGDNASPRTVSGSNTGLSNLTFVQNLAIDRNRALVYVNNRSSIKVWNNIDTVDGNVAPDRDFTVSGVTAFLAVQIDAASDRLYATAFNTGYRLFIFDDASTLNGTVTPNTTINLSTSTTGLFYEPVMDALYEWSSGGTISVYENATTLSAASTPNRTITLAENGGGANYQGLFVDGCNNRLILSHRNGSSSGNEIGLFSQASFLSGTLRFDTDSFARRDFGDVTMNVNADLANDTLIAIADSATGVEIYESYTNLSDDMGGPNRYISGTLNGGYGVGLFNY